MNDGQYPPLRLALLRHANALWPQPGESDFDRRLSSSGIEEARLAGEFLRDIGFEPEIALTSPALRCSQTLSHLQQTYGSELLSRAVPELYNSSREDYLQVLNQNRNFASVLLVGHNPTLEETLADLIGFDQMASIMQGGFETGACAILDIPSAPKGSKICASLLAHFAPHAQD